MHQLSIQKKHGICTLSIDSLEDLWYLTQLIEPGDTIKGTTTRKIKIEGGGDRAHAIIKKTLHLEIIAEKIHLTDTQLRITGTALHGTDDISAGQYHTFSLEPGSTFTLEKRHWLAFHWEKLEDACMPTHAPILIVIHDRETALFALLKKTGIETLTTLHGTVAKKQMEQHTGNFFAEIAHHIEQYTQRIHPESIILASPSFFKEYVHKLLHHTENIILATVSSVGTNALKELLHRDEVKTALAHDRNTQEQHKTEQLFFAIGKGEKACYGLESTLQAAQAGAVQEVLVTDTYLRKMHEEGLYDRLDTLFKSVDRAKGTITIISEAHEGGQRLNGIGGVGAILRFSVA